MKTLNILEVSSRLQRKFFCKEVSIINTFLCQILYYNIIHMDVLLDIKLLLIFSPYKRMDIIVNTACKFILLP